MKIDVPLWDQETKTWRVAAAELANVAPHLSATFAVHECPWGFGWTVSNVETGTRVNLVPYADTRREAVRLARKALTNISDAYLWERMEWATKQQFQQDSSEAK